MNVCMVAYSFYETDNRVRRYAETLARRGDRVDAIVLRRKGQAARDVLNGVNLYRIQSRQIDETSRLGYLVKLVAFFISSSLWLAVMHVRLRYDLIHVHSVPDWEVLAAWLPKIMGAKIILDIHDLVPELYASKFNAGRTSTVFRLLRLVEKASARFADHVIIANDLWRDRLTRRSIDSLKCTTVLNFPDDTIFLRRGEKKDAQKIVLLYPGTLNHHQGLDLAINAFGRIKDKVPNAEFRVYGTGPARDLLEALIRERGLVGRVTIEDPVPLEKIAREMEKADLGVVPKRTDSFGDEAFSTKILEFMAIGVPVLVSDSKVDRYYFNQSVVRYFRGGDEANLAENMLFLIQSEHARECLRRNAETFVRDYCWSARKNVFLDLVDSLCGRSKRCAQR